MKKFLSLFLSVCMVLTVLSAAAVPVSAETETWTEVNSMAALSAAAAVDGAHIRLTEDVTNTTGTLRGYVISVAQGAKLTIEDSSGTDSGRITGGYCMRGNGAGVYVRTNKSKKRHACVAFFYVIQRSYSVISASAAFSSRRAARIVSSSRYICSFFSPSTS